MNVMNHRARITSVPPAALTSGCGDVSIDEVRRAG
jgi:hypothetical protein